MAIFKQHTLPTQAKTGDAWVCPHKSFKRVLSRGGAWENVNLGEKHRDEVDHEQEQRIERSEPEQREPVSTEVSGGTSESTQGDGDDGQVSGVSADGGNGGEENSGVAPVDNHAEGEGVDGNGSPVV